MMKFTKMQGCGNDYIYVNCFEEKLENPSEISKIMSDRHFGIGSDGLILIKPSDKADFAMEMYNADGSEGKMCGNGIRCLAKYVYDNKMIDKKELSVETKSGIKDIKLHIKDEKVVFVTVDMGRPFLNVEKIPVISKESTVIDEPIIIDGKTYKITCVSVGNPHTIIFVKDLKKMNISRIGSEIEKFSIFPERTNVEFVEILDKNTIEMRVWERGAGETLACGTGACASVIAGFLNGKISNMVKVKLLGGELDIEYNLEKNRIFMTGPAVKVFDGEFVL